MRTVANTLIMPAASLLSLLLLLSLEPVAAQDAPSAYTEAAPVINNPYSYTNPSPAPLEEVQDDPAPAYPPTNNAAQQDSSASRTNQTSAADTNPSKIAAVSLETVPGCTTLYIDSRLPGLSRAYLIAGIGATSVRSNGCEVQGVLDPGQDHAYTFNLLAATNDERPYRVHIKLQTTHGTAQLGLTMTLLEQGRNNVSYYSVGTKVFESEVTSHQYIDVPWSIIQVTEGANYVITVTNVTARLNYRLQVSTPYLDTRLAESDTAAMVQLMEACCPADLVVDGSNSRARYGSCKTLKAALEPGHSDKDDMCNTLPLTCDKEGHLLELFAASVGLFCPNGLPSDLSGLSALHTLDLSFNAINSTLAQVAQMVSTLPALETAFLRYADLRGKLDCRVLAPPKLRRLSLSGNAEIVGEVPGCFLQELYLSATSLTGRLPDTLPRNSSLIAVFGIRVVESRAKGLQGLRAAGMRAYGTDPKNPGFTGPIPRSLLTSPSLEYLDLSNNRLTGALPRLVREDLGTGRMRRLNLSANALDGTFPGTLPSSMQVLDVSINKLTGSLPSDLSGYTLLSVFDVSNNRLSGSFPTGLPPNITVFDVSYNPKLGGALPSPLPASLVSLDTNGTRVSVPQQR